MRQGFLRTTVLFLLLFMNVRAEAGTSPARQFMDDLASNIRNMIKAGNVEEANLLFANNFDMSSFGKLCLIDHWEEFSGSEQKRFIYLLEQNIRQELRKRMLFTKEDGDFKLITMKVSKQNDDLVLLENSLVISKGKFRLDLLLKRNAGRYKIVDYELEGALLSRNYRGHFNYLLRKYDNETFLAKMAAKLEPENSPATQK